MNESENTLPPYPRLGEIYRAMAVAIGTKAGNRDVDRLAREGEFDLTLLPALGDELLVGPLAKSVDPEFADLVAQMSTVTNREGVCCFFGQAARW